MYEFRNLGWAGRLVLLGEKMFPPTNSVLNDYKKKSLLWLLLLYPYRMAGIALFFFREIRRGGERLR
jgi:hypothetical protein